MSRTLINFVLDLFLLSVTLAIVWTSFVLRFVFPPATTAAGWTLWGASYDAWSDLQFVLLAIVMLAILVHVMLHWTWVCGVIATRIFRRKAKTRDDGSLTLYGVGALIVVFNILGVALAAAHFSVSPPLP